MSQSNSQDGKPTGSPVATTAPAGLVQSSPDPERLMALAGEHFMDGRFAEAYEICHQVLDQNPNHLEALRLAAAAAFQTLQYADAASLLERAVAITPDDLESWFNLGQTWLKFDRGSEAEAAFSRILLSDPDNVEALTGRAFALVRLEKLEEAEAVFRKVVDLSPQSAEAYSNLGGVLEEQGKLAAAAVSFETALEIDPAHSKTIVNMGNLRMTQNEPDEAIAHYRRAIEIAPENRRAYLNLAAILHNNGKSEEARDLYRQTLDIFPNDVASWRNLVLVSMAMGDLEGALAATEGFFGVCDCNTEVICLKAEILREMGRMDEARFLMDFDRLIRPVPITEVKGYESTDAFNKAIVAHIQKHPSLIRTPKTKSTQGGRQTENFANEGGPIAAFRDVINAAARDYQKAVGVDPSHPFLAHPPDHWSLVIWGVVLESEGSQAPHIHSSAWLSGVYYPKLPRIIGASEDDHAGWIEFGRPGFALPTQREPEVRRYKPEEGLMFLFPSYLYHCTIPFREVLPLAQPESRISVAFDVVPGSAFSGSVASGHATE